MKTYKILFQVLGEKKAMYVQASSPQQATEILREKVLRIDSVIDKTDPQFDTNSTNFMDFFFSAINKSK